MYVFSKNPDISIKNWMNKLITENTLEMIHFQYYRDRNIFEYTNFQTQYNTKNFENRKLDISFSIENNITPIKITTNIYSLLEIYNVHNTSIPTLYIPRI